MNNSYSELANQLSAGKTVVAVTYGDSMEPLLYTNNTTVVIEPMKTTLAANELPLYRRPSGQFVMHRIIKVKDGMYYTRGDNRHGLEAVEHDWVLGVVTQINRKGKTFSVTDKGYITYVRLWRLIYPLRYVYYMARSIWKRLRKKW